MAENKGWMTIAEAHYKTGYATTTIWAWIDRDDIKARRQSKNRHIWEVWWPSLKRHIRENGTGKKWHVQQATKSKVVLPDSIIDVLTTTMQIQVRSEEIDGRRREQVIIKVRDGTIYHSLLKEFALYELVAENDVSIVIVEVPIAEADSEQVG